MDVSQAAVQRGSEDATEENHPTDSKQCSRTCNQEGYLLTKKRPPPHLFKLISLAGRAAPVVSKDKMHRASSPLSAGTHRHSRLSMGARALAHLPRELHSSEHYAPSHLHFSILS